MGPLPVITGFITPITRVIRTVSHIRDEQPKQQKPLYKDPYVVDGNQKSGINSPVEVKVVVFFPLFTRFSHHPRWLFVFF